MINLAILLYYTVRLFVVLFTNISNSAYLNSKGALYMKLDLMKNSIVSGTFDSKFDVLYKNAEDAVKRYSDSCDRFAELFGENRDVELFSAPGRTEVGGNHTDHQLGCVLAGSVNLDVIAVASKNSDMTVRVKSEGFDMDTVDMNVSVPLPDEREHAASLIRGVCVGLSRFGYKIGGFDAYTTSNVLKGSGLSSSAAFEVLIGNIISYLYNDGKIDAVTIAKAAQYAENEFFGKPSGLMDQMASSVGGFTSIDFGDKENPIIEKVDFDFASSGHSLCIVNTGGNHADLTGEYAAVTGEMKKISGFFGEEYLRKVDEEQFYSKISELRLLFGDRAVLRAIHFFEDNRRAIDERDALKAGDFNQFLKLVNESGRSSFMNLQNVYSSLNVEEQGLTLALAISTKVLGDRGACRVHGGGFGGTIQAFVPNDMLENYKSSIEQVFGVGSCYVLNIRPVGGTKIS